MQQLFDSREIRMRFILTSMCLVALTAGCATPAPLVAPEPERVLGVGPIADYRLGVADKIKLTVYREETLTGEYSVEADGKLAIPIVGRIQAAGKTPAELSQQISGILSQGYMRDPHVVAQIVEYRPYFILGEVNKPGKYSYSSGLTVLAAVAAAEGFSYRADEKRVLIKSQNDSVERAIRITPDLGVLPGDVIRIEVRSF